MIDKTLINLVKEMADEERKIKRKNKKKSKASFLNP